MKTILRCLFASWVCTAMAADFDPEALGRQYSERFLSADTAGIWQAMTAQMQEALRSESEFGSFAGQVVAQAGKPGMIIREELIEEQGFFVFRQVRRFGKIAQPIVLQWAFDGEGRVAGFFVRPLPEPPSDAFEDYATRTSLRLPFDGEWFVFWGGRERWANYHVDYPNQRYAYDFVVQRDGVSYEGDAGVLENYYCWGRPILVPADGTVLRVEKSQPDQVPGQMDPTHPAGNYVIIDHGGEEYSLLAHMQQGSISVRKGAFVIAGQEIGSCGNSGNTSEPHLHYHLQNGPGFGEGHGLPAPFVNYLANGKVVDRGEPERGQFISPAPE